MSNKADSIDILVTEGINSNTKNIDNVSTLEIINMINNQDKKVAYAIEKSKKSISMAVDLIFNMILKGGRLIYVGAGTSGRLGIVDASECPPTFGVDFDLIQGIIAGGKEAMFKAIEGAEDNEKLGAEDLRKKNITNKDVICGIAASGRTPYVIGAMKYGKKIGASIISITMNKNSIMSKESDIPISVEVGPEVIMGSTRMKAGTAEKMILNMLTTGTMIKLGKVYKNLMVDVVPTNKKLLERAKRIIQLATQVDKNTAEKYLEITNNNVKLSIFMIKTGLNKQNAEIILNKNKGYIQKSIEEFKSK